MSVPDWIIIKRINEVSVPREEMQIDMENWPIIAQDRVNKFVHQQRWYPAEGANRGNYNKEIYDEFAGHGLLRIVAAEDTRVQGWLVEQEGDLFEWRFLKAKTTDTKVEVAKYIFGDNKVLGPRDLWSHFNIEENDFKEFKMGTKRTGSIAVHFTCAPKLVSNRSALLRNGWVISLIDDFANSVKIAFEQKLRERIRESKESIDRIARSSIQEPVAKLKEELSKVIHSMSASRDGIVLSDFRLFTRQSVFPQCMLDLYNEVMNHGHINHVERLQLGLFLKNIGMTVEEQLHFWYERAVDNIGLTFDQFSNGAPGYQIKYMYGLVGGGTDYSAHKCSSIQDDSYCPFIHQSVKTIEDNLRKEFKSPSQMQEDLIRNLIRLVVDKKPSEACAVMFQLRYNKKAYPSKHPISYLRYAAKILKLIDLAEDKPEDIKEPKAKE
ncbi:MAG: hypothetical protein JXA54_12090 [Candidatus Heimdallarchaeota archaeon]|nr:hypothetical protein [Candidatus Heimdallarchaeota archaeon]